MKRKPPYYRRILPLATSRKFHSPFDHAFASWYGGYLQAFLGRHGDEQQTVIPDAADWIQSPKARLREGNDFKAQTIL